MVVVSSDSCHSSSDGSAGPCSPESYPGTPQPMPPLPPSLYSTDPPVSSWLASSRPAAPRSAPTPTASPPTTGHKCQWSDCNKDIGRAGLVDHIRHAHVDIQRSSESYVCLWMGCKEGTTDKRVQSHPPQCTTSRADRQIVRMAVTDRSVTSRTVAQHIQSVMHHPVSAHTIRRHLHQSGLSTRCPLLCLPLTQNYRRLHSQWCDERRMWTAEWNDLLMSYTSVCNTTMVGFESGDTV
ncbi:hypothetical protein LAZ67_X001922 [Cordylochernes scorpioides]|uniref:Transposase Tc1-like domain-containing protein n=1 Tax=Cordylochernes scorpioides TaxID=51811 RepID=A0ABY6LTD3_9ARAC|nr:hypothetical protein LAZ67_X001922 [Cordylochernes scorpioides]